MLAPPPGRLGPSPRQAGPLGACGVRARWRQRGRRPGYWSLTGRQAKAGNVHLGQEMHCTSDRIQVSAAETRPPEMVKVAQPVLIWSKVGVRRAPRTGGLCGRVALTHAGMAEGS